MMWPIVLYYNSTLRMKEGDLSQENKAIIRKLYENAYNQNITSIIDELYSPEVELHIAGIPEDPFGPLPIKQLIAMMRTAFPNYHTTIDDLIASGDKVVASISFNGKFQGTFGGHSPSQNLSWWKRIDIYRIYRGKIVEQWGDRDDFTLLQRIGVTVPKFDDIRPLAREAGRL
ncbi:MAG: ester cyclase [SAR202 cluster bacterium]|nr:ester cyclase [SAR202 cluster bacterium]